MSNTIFYRLVIRSHLFRIAIFLFATVILSSCSQNSPSEAEEVNTKKELETNGNDALYPIPLDSKMGLIDSSGKVILPPTFDQITTFYGNIALMRRHDSVFTINNRLNIEFITDSVRQISSFNNHLACIVFQPQHSLGVAFINDEGKLFSATNLKSSSPDITKLVSCNHIATETFKNGAVTFLSVQGKIVPGYFFRASDFSECLAAAATSDNLFGFIDTTGNWIIKPQFLFAGSFADGLARVKTQKNGWGYIDKNGKLVLGPDFKNLTDFNEGFAIVEDLNGWHLMNREGKLISKLKEANSYMPVHEGFFSFESKGLFGFRSVDGRSEIPAQFEQVYSFNRGLALVKGNRDNWMYINKNGVIIWQQKNN